MSLSEEERDEARRILQYLEQERTREQAVGDALERASKTASRVHKMGLALFGAVALIIAGAWRVWNVEQRITDSARELEYVRQGVTENRSANEKQTEKILQLGDRTTKLEWDIGELQKRVQRP